MSGPHEIRDASFNVSNASNTPPSRTASRTRTEHQQHAHAEDSVNLSPISQERESIQEAISRLPEIRKDRVERISQALNAGTYRVSSEQVADRIIQETILNSTNIAE